MKKKVNIVFSVFLIFAVFIFSSFKSYQSHNEKVEKIKTEKNDNENKKEELKSIDYEATVSVNFVFAPIALIKSFVKYFVQIEDEFFTFNFNLKSQAFYRIFFTHIISKNAP